MSAAPVSSLALSDTAKDAIRTSIAMVTVFWIALRMGWDNPHWAGIAVAVISAPTVGQSLDKGMRRLGGTLLGVVAALFLLALFPQDRYLFLAASSLFGGVCTYLMTRNQSYFWQVAALVCFIVVLAGPADSAEAIYRAGYRFLETAMGIIVFTVLSVFLWPRSNRGALLESARSLVTTQRGLYEALRAQMRGTAAEDDIRELQQQQTQLLRRFSQLLTAAGAEAYGVRRSRKQLLELQRLAEDYLRVAAQCAESLRTLRDVDMDRLVPELAQLDTEVEKRFVAIAAMLDGAVPEAYPTKIELTTDAAVRVGLPPFALAAATVTKQHLQQIEMLTRELVACVGELTGSVPPSSARFWERARPGSSAKRLSFPILDPDRLRAAAMVVITTWVAFLIWVYINPPGHAGFVQTAAIFALVTAMMQASPKVMLLPFGTSIPIGIAVYVLVLPGLSRFSELAVLMFLYTFASVYFLRGGGATISMMGFLVAWGITNQQTYSFPAVVSTYVMLVLAICLVAATSYLIRAPRPEKQFLVLVRRFFRSAAVLLESAGSPRPRRAKLWRRWRNAYHRQQLATLPAKLAVSANRIDPKRFPDNPREKTQALLNDLQTLAYRLEAFVDETARLHAERLPEELRHDLDAWAADITATLRQWSQDPAASTQDLADSMSRVLSEFEKKLAASIDQSGGDTPDEHRYEDFYRLLGSYHGVSFAALAFAGRARGMDWSHWREERF